MAWVNGCMYTQNKRIDGQSDQQTNEHSNKRLKPKPPTKCAGRWAPAEKLWQGLWCERTSHRCTAPSRPAVASTWGRSGHHARSFTGLCVCVMVMCVCGWGGGYEEDGIWEHTKR